MAAEPLSPMPSAALNVSTPSNGVRHHHHLHDHLHADRQSPYEFATTTSTTSTTGSTMDDNNNHINSSSSSSSNHSNSSNGDDIVSPTPRGPSPAKSTRPGSRIITGSELSPLKILQQNHITHAAQHQQTAEDPLSPSPGTPGSGMAPGFPPHNHNHQHKHSGSSSNMAPPPLPSSAGGSGSGSGSNSNSGLSSPRKAPIVKRFPVRISGQQPDSSSAGGVGGGGRRESSSPVRRRQSNEQHQFRSSQHQLQQDAMTMSLSDHEEGFKKRAIEIFEDDESAFPDDIMDEDHEEEGDNDNKMDHDGGGGGRNNEEDEIMQDHSGVNADDTVMSTFSTFSAVPNHTMLTGMRSDSPTKFSASVSGSGATPRGRSGGAGDSARTPKGGAGNGPDRSGTHQLYDSQNSAGSSNLMDFTEQLRFGSYNGGAGGSQPTPSRRGQSIGPGNGVAQTPQRSGPGGDLVNLLDFDITPMPTPRSIPTITPRELESLKSGFLSEISSLKASLSGKEAEVLSLKTAVGDAEKRVGECLEQLREVESVQEALASEKDNWERRGREMEAVLRKVKEEIVLGQREREELEFKLDEAEKRREAAEMMAQDAESKMAGMRAGKASAEAANDPRSPGIGALSSNKEVEIAVERVARELHALYKSKHETKVAALKKSYETRWEKKVRELQGQVDELAAENEELRRIGGARDDRRADSARIAELEEERKAERAQNAAHIRELQAESQKLEAILKTVQADNSDLRVLLERERVEKGELVQLAEEMMNMQQSFLSGGGGTVVEEPEPEPEREPVREPVRKPSPPAPAPVRELVNGAAKTPARRQSSSISSYGGKTPLGVRSSMPPPASYSSNENAAPSGNNFRMSVNGGAPNFRASGLRAPGSSLGGKPSMIGRAGSQHNKSNSVAGSLPRPGSGLGTSRGLMGSIEKMGAGASSGYGRRYNGD
ncbi:hypothetical protein QBC42DRAFT_222809 [Cladorrhinum samala]|uniref:Uncharacterized protein n=1 Tax=Cladorrhinum samala TaxID=585594 RepID=A0AAV9HRL7_9PEZI|nr:hypothetical protein QBC42DRAFT_222809 [Cladorrhinum samala]